MQARIQKWGNSLALRIPKNLATEAHLAQEAVVELAVAEGKLVVAPVPLPNFTLKKLLAGITESNLHSEVESGPAVGSEAW